MSSAHVGLAHGDLIMAFQGRQKGLRSAEQSHRFCPPDTYAQRHRHSLPRWMRPPRASANWIFCDRSDAEPKLNAVTGHIVPAQCVMRGSRQ